ncbi:MAG TPA: flagellin [Xanthobacteraceae bacterium]|nr:flagellin [Xanthobacteraceae bacterium]
MSDITLTSGIRQNLLSLQQTAADLTTTQQALSTGKAVNSAADNPSAYFTSQNLTNTANSLSALLDSVGQGQQTIDAATNGLQGITSLLQQALSTVQQAQQAAQTAGATTGTVAVTTATVTTAGTLSILVGASTYAIAVAATETASAIEAAINATTGLGSTGALTATDNGSGKIVLTANSGATSFSVSDNATSEVLGLTTAGSATAVYGTSSARTTLQTNYNGLLSQISQLSADSGYNGVNLLGGNNLTIDFNPTGTSSLTIQGVSYNATGLGLSSVSGSSAASFQDNSSTGLGALVTDLNNAITSVQTQTETFGTNSGVIGTRQKFETAMINTLQTGASNLVVADQNQESANLLTEQTQQQLEISALSIANQANQSVLKLFG